MTRRILVVDDEELVCLFFKKALEAEGYEVRVALNGTTAIELVEKQPVDLVFTDLIMPGMDGVELCKAIKERHPKTQVIMVSGHPSLVGEKMIPFWNAGGREEILRKPISEEEILNTAKRVLEIR